MTAPRRTGRLCGVCGALTADGYLCGPDTRRLRDTLRQAPEWADQMDLVRARLTRYTDGGQGRRSRETPLPYNPAATAPAAALDRAIRHAAHTIGAPTTITASRLGVVTAYLIAHLPDLRRRPDAPEHHHRITAAVADCTTAADRPPDRWYAGRCPCGTDLYPPADHPVVACPTCARTWPVEVRRRQLLAQVRHSIAPGPDIARALTTLATPVTPERLRKWRHEGRLHVHHLDPGPPATNWYRVGDVIDLVTAEALKRARRQQP